MSKKWIITLSIVVFLFSFHNLAWSSVEGMWDVTGSMTIKVSIPGEGSDKVTTPFTDTLIFYADNSFQMGGMHGTWNQKKSAYKVFLDEGSIETSFEELFWDYYELDTSCDITKVTFKGTENTKKQTIKGTMNIKMNIHFFDFDVIGKVTISAKLSGTRAVMTDLIGTYALRGFTIQYSDDTSFTQDDIPYFSGTMSITSNTLTQFIEINDADIYATGTYTASFFNDHEGVLHVNDGSSSHDVYFSISGNYFTTYSGVMYLGGGITFEEWDYWEKISNTPSITSSALSAASKNMLEKQIKSDDGLFTGIGKKFKQ